MNVRALTRSLTQTAGCSFSVPCPVFVPCRCSSITDIRRIVFWPLVTMLLGYAEVPLDYADKKQMLLDNRIALWDVLGYCEREGSLDSDITCEQPNDLAGFLQNHPQIHTICCNGGKAAAAFKKYTRQLDLQRITVHFLPSTSPANARWSLTKLLEAWQVINTGR